MKLILKFIGLLFLVFFIFLAFLKGIMIAAKLVTSKNTELFHKLHFDHFKSKQNVKASS
ncbi:MAG: hypothetical protein KGZ38_01550 [Erysipelothrix sp.]|nr:hypothetical protein [Erysipelothrix sp.]